MKFKKIYLIGAAAIIGAGFLFYLAQATRGPEYKTAKVLRESIAQEISETGAVKKGDPVALNFKNSGTVQSVNVKTGQDVAAGQVLAELDASQLKLQLAQAKASLDLYRIQLEKLKNGASVQDLNLATTGVDNAREAFESAKQGLADAQASSRQKMDNAYKSAITVLESAYAKAYNAQNYASLLQRTYFTPQDKDSVNVWQASQKIANAVETIKKYLSAAKASGKGSDVDLALKTAQEQLDVINGAIEGIRVICEGDGWKNSVVTADKNSLDTHRDYVVAAATSVSSSIQSIALQEATNANSINTAQAALTAAQGALNTSKEQYNKTSADPRNEDVEALLAQIAQAEAQVKLLELQIGDSQLKAPVAGQIIEVNAKVGQNVSLIGAGEAVTLLPGDPFYVEVDIYEEDVVKVKIGDPVKITPAAVEDAVYDGRVLEVDPSGKVVNGVVYYKTKISFNGAPENLKPEMSADVVIITASKADALTIPESALQKQEGNYYVQILKNGKPADVRVDIGIVSKGVAEALSGLDEGQEVIIP